MRCLCSGCLLRCWLLSMVGWLIGGIGVCFCCGTLLRFVSRFVLRFGLGCSVGTMSTMWVCWVVLVWCAWKILMCCSSRLLVDRWLVLWLWVCLMIWWLLFVGFMR